MSQTLLELELNVRKATNTCIAWGELIGEDRNHHCDEKKIGRRDSMMLNGRKHPTRENTITNQQFDSKQVKEKIAQIKDFHCSALHWNIEEIRTSFPSMIKKAKFAYRKLEDKLGVEFHSEAGIEKFAEKFCSSVEDFRDFSREKARNAQNREFQTQQPKEALSSLTKAKVTIGNYLGGEYYLTTDEVRLTKKKVHLIEAKHSKNSILPSLGDIKDGLLKMILYANLVEVQVDGVPHSSCPVLKLTSCQMNGDITSVDSLEKQKHFFLKNELPEKKIELLTSLFAEAKENNFLVTLEKAQ